MACCRREAKRQRNLRSLYRRRLNRPQSLPRGVVRVVFTGRAKSLRREFLLFFFFFPFNVRCIFHAFDIYASVFEKRILRRRPERICIRAFSRATLDTENGDVPSRTFVRAGRKVSSYKLYIYSAAISPVCFLLFFFFFRHRRYQKATKGREARPWIGGRSFIRQTLYCVSRTKFAPSPPSLPRQTTSRLIYE